MTGDDLKRMQDTFLEGAQQHLRKHGHLSPIGFVVTLHKHVDKLFESGYGIEFLEPKDALHDGGDDEVATLIVDLAMDGKKLYHAVMAIAPEVRDVLPKMIDLGRAVAVEDPHKHVMRAFMESQQLNEKDIIAATMRHICAQVDAFASIFHSEAWLLAAKSRDDFTDAPADFSKDAASVEVLSSSMETYAFARMLTLPIVRQPPRPGQKRDAGKIVGFGKQIEMIASPDNGNSLEGRLMRFLKPLKEAS